MYDSGYSRNKFEPEEMEFYYRIIENPLFFKWIFHPSPEINAYWEHYLSINTKYADDILNMKSKINKYFKYEDSTLTDIEKQQLAKRIMLKMDFEDKKNSKKRAIYSFMRYAAVAFLFLCIGGGVVYFIMNKQQISFIANNFLPDTKNEPMLFVGNKKPIVLNRGETVLDYSNKGQIMLNKDQRISSDVSQKFAEINTLVIPYGSRSQITLSDSTKVWLNAGSKLIYPTQFVDKIREVYLVGEAFFEVSKNKHKPFVVKTNDVKVEVLGTEFNMTAYPEDFSVQTVLKKGSVKIKKTNCNKFDKGILLKPGQLAYFNKKTKNTQIQNVNVEHYTLWTEGLFAFENTDFSRIIKKLERYYNIKFQIDNPFKGGIKISGKLDVTKDRKEVFTYLERLTGLNFYQINNNNYQIK